MNSYSDESPGSRLRTAIEEERPLQMVGTINAFCSLLAEAAGFKAVYLSGAGVANASFGLPDLGMTTVNEVAEDVRRITATTNLPLMVDADTGWGSAFNIARAVRELSRAGAAGCHIEDQVQAKRCGHRPNKELVDPPEMVDRIKAAVDGRTDSTFVLMARTDAVGVEGVEPALERCEQYIEAGADLIFAEAVTTLDDYHRYLTLLHGDAPNEIFRRALDVSLILYAEHEFNASTFACRVCAATLSDFYSCIVSAIGTLRGPLHGGANEAAMELIQKFRSRGEARTAVLEMLAKKQKIMGFGHAVYKNCDPRNAIIKGWSRQLSESAPDGFLFDLSTRSKL